jgi:molecular chaperone GrpE
MLKKIRDIMSKKEKSPEMNSEKMEDSSTILDEQIQNETANTEKATKKSNKLTKEEKLKLENEEMKIQIAELKDKYLRLFAEFDNYKKRTIKEKIDLMKTAAQDTMSALLPVLDDFDRAKKNAEDENKATHFDNEGVLLVYNKLKNSLSQKGLQAMESNGQDFDPELHEAITEIPVPDKKMIGKIIDTVEKGYLLKDKIIRHAKVVVGK